MFGDPCCCFPLFAKCFSYFPLFAHLVMTCVPLIAIRFNAAIALFARTPRFEASGERGKSHGRSGFRRIDELDAVLDHAQLGEDACCNCRVLNLVSTRSILPLLKS